MSSNFSSVRGLSGGERAALLISECQNWNTDPSCAHRVIAEEAAKREIVPKISRLAEACRNVGVPVLIAMHTPRPDYAGMRVNCAVLHTLKKGAEIYDGSQAAELNPLLNISPQDWIFRRRQGLTDFSGSELDQVLRNLDVESVILTGVSTNLGVLGNAIDVVNRGWNAILAEDCTAGAPPEHHRYLVQTTYSLIATVTSSDDIIHSLRTSNGQREPIHAK
jgi:nicotinamidase-related amidase